MTLLNKQINLRMLILLYRYSCSSVLFCFHFFKQQIPFIKGKREQPVPGKDVQSLIAFNITHYFIMTQLQKQGGRNH